MILIYVLIAAFFAVWIGFAIRHIRSGGSKIVGIGGGFIAGTLPAAVISGALMLFDSSPIPESLDTAGLVGKKWDVNATNMAARITVKNLREIHLLVSDAGKRGDTKAAGDSFAFLTPMLFSWNVQDDDGLGNFRNCKLAVAHLADGALIVKTGGRFNSDRFEAALSACSRSAH